MDSSTFIDNINAKIRRAYGHIEAIEQILSSSVSPHPNEMRREYDPISHELKFYLTQDARVPVEVSIIVGEALHQLRSCLDHVTWQCASLHGDTEPHKHCSFPIHTTREAFRAGVNKLHGLTTQDIALLEFVQPFAIDSYREHPLFRLRELNNADKHRRLSVVSAISGPQEFSSPDYRDVEAVTDMRIREMKAGGHVFTMETSNPKVDVNFGVVTIIVFDEECVDLTEDAVSVLKDIFWYTHAVLRQFVRILE
jgi:hypothetical protein